MLALHGDPAARARGRVAGAAEPLTAGCAGGMAGERHQMQLVVANEARPVEPRPRLAERRLDSPRKRVPVDPDQPFAFATPDQHLETLDRYVELQRLNPIDRDPQGVVPPQVVELRPIFPLDGANSHGFPPAVGFGLLSFGAHQGGEPLQRCTPHIVVISVHAVAAALPPAAHGAQESPQTGPDPGAQRRPYTTIKRYSVPTPLRGGGGLR